MSCIPAAIDNLLAGVAARRAARDLETVQTAYDEHGLALHEQQPDHHYVHRYFGGRKTDKLRTPLEDPGFFELADRVQRDGRTLLYYDRLFTLYQALRNAARRAKPGRKLSIAEVGVYRGGSALFLASVAEKLRGGDVELTAIDTFEGHSELDLPSGKEGQHSPRKFGRGTSHEAVEDYLSAFPFVDVLKGRVQDVAPTLSDHTFDLVHLDVDVYEPTAFSLAFFAERTAPGAVIVVDDFGFKTCPGVREAVDEFLAEGRGFTPWEPPTGQCILCKD